jgi:hypothetical protein
MGRLVAVGALCEQEAAAALIEQGQRIGLGPTECERTVASGLSAGIELTFAGNIIETGTVSYRLAHAQPLTVQSILANRSKISCRGKR